MAAVPTHARVAVVGGGFAGAATAYFLTCRGVRDVVVLERERTCGYHASGRNAALGRQLTEHPTFTELAIRGAAFLRKPPPDVADAPLLSSSGSMLLASTDETLTRVLGTARRHGVPCEAIAPAAVVERWPLLRGCPLAGAAMFPTDGVIDIHGALQGLLGAARAGGARVEVGTEVTGFTPRPGGVDVATNRGTVRSRIVVNAAGAWVAELAARTAARPIAFEPIRRHLHVTEPIRALDPTAPFAWHLDDEFYVRPESGAVLVSACDATVVAPCDPSSTPDAVPALAAKLERMAPAFGDYGIAHSWACLRTFTADGSGPRITWDPTVSWLFWVAGLGGHGATSSAAVGERAAAAIAARLR